MKLDFLEMKCLLQMKLPRIQSEAHARQTLVEVSPLAQQAENRVRFVKAEGLYFDPSGLRLRASLVAQAVKVCPQCRRLGFDPWVGKIP